jgi:hypothetical protein
LKTRSNPTRREFLLALPWWFPFFWRRHTTLAGMRFEVHRADGPITWLVIHGNETTARDVLREHLRHNGGRAFLAAGRERNVRTGGALIDPNRMFSRAGAGASLRRLNPGLGESGIQAALARLDRERPKLIRALLPPPGGLLFALHNNSGGYSVRDEVPISDEVSLGDPANPHEFFLATDPADFARLSLGPVNAVYQRHKPATDDGSLSRLAARLGVRYINLEVGLGKADVQGELMQWALARVYAK